LGSEGITAKANSTPEVSYSVVASGADGFARFAPDHTLAGPDGEALSLAGCLSLADGAVASGGGGGHGIGFPVDSLSMAGLGRKVKPQTDQLCLSTQQGLSCLCEGPAVDCPRTGPALPTDAPQGRGAVSQGAHDRINVVDVDGNGPPVRVDPTLPAGQGADVAQPFNTLDHKLPRLQDQLLGRNDNVPGNTGIVQARRGAVALTIMHNGLGGGCGGHGRRSIGTPLVWGMGATLASQLVPVWKPAGSLDRLAVWVYS